MASRTFTASSAIDGLAEMFAYLDALRLSGVTNMFGATPYLQEEFSLPRNHAQKVLGLWMKTFNENAATVRAAEALSILAEEKGAE